MNGIKVVFGITNNVMTRCVLKFGCFVLFITSCELKDTTSCDWEKELYKEKWDYIVKGVDRYEKYQATYVIKTTSGKEILIRPKQYLITISNPGDRIIKNENSGIAYVIFHDTGDTIESRIFSEICDSIVRCSVVK